MTNFQKRCLRPRRGAQNDWSLCLLQGSTTAQAWTVIGRLPASRLSDDEKFYALTNRLCVSNRYPQASHDHTFRMR
jgi:hypothetical protein